MAGPIARRMPRTLAAAAHVTAAGAWAFTLAVGVLALIFSGDGIDGFFFVLIALLLLGPVLLALLLGGLAVMAVGATVTLPLAVAWWRTPNREGNGGFALAHVAVATVVALVVLVGVVA